MSEEIFVPRLWDRDNVFTKYRKYVRTMRKRVSNVVFFKMLCF